MPLTRHNMSELDRGGSDTISFDTLQVIREIWDEAKLS